MASTEPIPRAWSNAKRSRTPFWGLSEPLACPDHRPGATGAGDRNPIEASGSRPAVSFNQVLSKARRSICAGRPVCEGFR
jgi:hypothetical protein